MDASIFQQNTMLNYPITGNFIYWSILADCNNSTHDEQVSPFLKASFGAVSLTGWVAGVSIP